MVWYESRERFRYTSMHKWRIRIDTDFHGKNTDFPHEIVACLTMQNFCSILRKYKLLINVIKLEKYQTVFTGVNFVMD